MDLIKISSNHDVLAAGRGPEPAAPTSPTGSDAALLSRDGVLRWPGLYSSDIYAEISTAETALAASKSATLAWSTWPRVRVFARPPGV